ncbi:hypothetical protein [Streptomyces coelicoflavus]
MDRLWQPFMHGFDLDHPQLLKQTLVGRTTAGLREPATGDGWT